MGFLSQNKQVHKFLSCEGSYPAAEAEKTVGATTIIPGILFGMPNSLLFENRM